MKTLTKRERDLVILLIRSDKTQSSGSIATLLDVTTRTIRNDVRALNSVLKEFGASIISYKGRGYKLEISNYKKFEEFEQSILAMPAEGDLAKRVIGNLLINTFTDKILNQQDLADSLYISLSTLKNILPEVNNELQKINLIVKTDQYSGIRIVGKEDKIRFGISEFIFNDEASSYKNYSYLFPINEMDELKEIIENTLCKHNLLLTDVAINGLIVHVMIAKSRSAKNTKVTYSEKEKQIENTAEFAIAKEIINEVKIELGDDISSEIYYITRHLIASGRLDTGQMKSIDHENIIAMIETIVSIIKDRTSFDFSKDTELQRNLAVHLSAALNRIKFNMNIRNEYLSTIKSDYPLAFELAVIACEELKKITGLDIEENEIGFIAIHFGAALEIKQLSSGEKIKKIIVVCGSGLATASLIRKKLKMLFRDLVVDIETVSLSEFKDKTPMNADYILSTVPINHAQSENMKIINPILSNQDLNDIKDFVDGDQENVKWNIRKFFTKELFVKGIKLESKMEVLHYLTSLMEQHGYIDKETKESIYTREKMASTELGRLLAIPHPLNNRMSKAIVAVCVLDKPIIWDKEKVQVILVLSIPQKDIAIWETVFRRIYEFLIEDIGIGKLITEYDYEDFIRNLEQGRWR